MSMSVSLKKETKKTNIKHNNRTMSEKEKARNAHIDYSKSHENEYLVQKDLKQLYREEFDEALAIYNAKQKRSDRKIDDYYKHIQSSKKTALQQEMIIQVGDKDDFSSQENVKMANEVLQEWFQGFEMRNPNLKVYNAVIHNDEASPHMHLNFVPVASGYKRGLDKQVSFDRAIIQQDDTLNKERPFDDWREKEVQLLENLLKTRGIERKLVGTNAFEDVNAFKEKQRELEALALVEKEMQAKSAELDQCMERIQTTKNELAAIQQIDARKFVKGGLGKLLKLTDERVELALPDYDKLIKMGRQNVKLRNENRILSSQAHEVAQREKALNERERMLNMREQEINERQQVFIEHVETLTEREKTLNANEKRVDAMYARQSDLNGLLEHAESENKALKAENGVLRASVQKLEQMVADLRKQLRGAFERLTNVVKTVGMLKYDDEDYKANLTKKQGDLIDAISEYAERQAKQAGFVDLADEMNKHIGISDDIERHLPKEKKRSRSHNMDL